jgi:peptidoglycan hydrolase-like protein with peptidoglycan-binding domain
VRNVQTMLTELGFDADIADGVLGSQTLAAIRGYKRWKAIEKDGTVLSPRFIAALSASAGRDKPLDGQIMVRQKFKPVFEAAIGIRDPEKGLGTHFLEASHVDRFKGKVEWQSVSIDNHLPEPTMKRLGITQPADDASLFTAEAALARLDIPGDIRAKIETMLSEGSSITISDSGIGPETGDGTDFITVTRTKG